MISRLKRLLEKILSGVKGREEPELILDSSYDQAMLGVPGCLLDIPVTAHEDEEFGYIAARSKSKKPSAKKPATKKATGKKPAPKKRVSQRIKKG